MPEPVVSLLSRDTGLQGSVRVPQAVLGDGKTDFRAGRGWHRRGSLWSALKTLESQVVKRPELSSVGRGQPRVEF